MAFYGPSTHSAFPPAASTPPPPPSTKVKHLFAHMAECGVQPSSSIYTTLVNTFAQKGQWDDAIGVLSHMCRWV